jgi:hypothetical protein
MTQTATLLLLLAGAPTSAERRLLADFADHAHVTFVAPAPTPVAPYPAYRGDLVLDLEGRLDEARTLASSLDEEHALAVLATVERDLSNHPELPQAAWLMAEHHRIEAEARRDDPAASAEVVELSRAAVVLEGPRAPAFGVTSGAAELEPSLVTVTVRDLDARDRLEIDGQGGGPERELAPGVHQVRVLRERELVFASWERLGEHADVTLGVRPVATCSDEELAAADTNGTFVRVREPVACANWFVARRTSRGLEVARCGRSACGAFVALAEAPPKAAPFPPWATAALVGAGAVAAGFIAVWATGGFEHGSGAPPKTVFVYGGLH